MEGKLNLPGSTEGSFRQLAFELEAEAPRQIWLIWARQGPILYPKFFGRLFLIRTYWNPKSRQGPGLGGLTSPGAPERSKKSAFTFTCLFFLSTVSKNLCVLVLVSNNGLLFCPIFIQIMDNFGICFDFHES